MERLDFHKSKVAALTLWEASLIYLLTAASRRAVPPDRLLRLVSTKLTKRVDYINFFVKLS